MKKREERQEIEKRTLEAEALKYEICKLQDEMAATLSNFSNTIDTELLEYYTYFYKASTIKHSYMLKKLKKLYYSERNRE